MKPTPFNLTSYAANCHKLILAGWIPCGEHGQMFFEKAGRVYDLSAANLDLLDRIEKENLCLMHPDRVNDLTWRMEQIRTNHKLIVK